MKFYKLDILGVISFIYQISELKNIQNKNYLENNWRVG
jgi:hypothetical protein